MNFDLNKKIEQRLDEVIKGDSDIEKLEMLKTMFPEIFKVYSKDLKELKDKIKDDVKEFIKLRRQNAVKLIGLFNANDLTHYDLIDNLNDLDKLAGDLK